MLKKSFNRMRNLFLTDQHNQSCSQKINLLTLLKVDGKKEIQKVERCGTGLL